MNVKTMEGLAGAGTSISMISTPMSVAKEAERKGETDKMVRALGYAAGLKEQAEQYGEKASQGMKLDAKEAREQENLRQEQLIQARKEEREEQEKQIAARSDGTKESESDSAEISEEGKLLAETAGQVPAGSVEGRQDVTYGRSGEMAEAVQETGEYVDVSV